MTPKELLEKHNGDPLAAVHTSGSRVRVMETIRRAVRAQIVFDAKDAVTKTIAHLGEDGAEKWGRALMGVLGHLSFVQYGFEELVGDEITRIANATDRERLAACVVALAEVE